MLYLALVLTAGQKALASNNWSVPCTQGKCSWDMPVHSGASGSVNISGPLTAISDITMAAGWQMKSCNQTAMGVVDIQLVCKDDNPDCDHLFQGGAVDTIIRLPDSCGSMPFARVAQHQVLPSNSSSVDGSPVHVLVLDTNFAAANPPQGGSVQFNLQGMNMNGSTNVGMPASPALRRASSLDRSLDKIHRRHIPNNGWNAQKRWLTFNRTASQNTYPVDFSGAANLFNTSIGCPSNAGAPTISSSASVSLDVDANVHVGISLGAVTAGTIIPPKISELGLHFALDGNIDANLSIAANISGNVSSGSIPLFQVGIPGLSIPGILEIGPEFKLTSQIDAQFELTDVEAFVGLTYNLNGVSFVFPPQAADSQKAGFTPGTNNQLKISAGPNVSATFEAMGHLIPQLDVGLSGLGGMASASMFLNLDASADLTVSETTSPQMCIGANTGINVGVGAQGSFFGIFDSSVGASLFNQSFPLLQKCFGAPNPSSSTPAVVHTGGLHRRAYPPLDRGSILPLRSKRSDLGLQLSCPPASKAGLIISTSVP